MKISQYRRRTSDKDFVKQNISSFLKHMRTYMTFNIQDYTWVISIRT